ncbi:unnamed protein product [marine sediment metagenome]|uniref:Uncharacterized protein n=1 Tax=marine sediment metagenome TaxID=412755 RepID=X1IMN4_9ZZZZ
MTIKAREPWVGEDNSSENVIKNTDGSITYRRSRYTVRQPFDITKQWVPTNDDIVKILRKICECEDQKYPNGLGRNMLLLKHIYPIFKNYLDTNGFKPQLRDLEFSEREGK